MLIFSVTIYIIPCLLRSNFSNICIIASFISTIRHSQNGPIMASKWSLSLMDDKTFQLIGCTKFNCITGFNWICNFLYHSIITSANSLKSFKINDQKFWWIRNFVLFQTFLYRITFTTFPIFILINFFCSQMIIQNFFSANIRDSYLNHVSIYTFYFKFSGTSFTF